MTHRQHDANRRNARRSTGPASNSGKANASRNALKHGLWGAPVLTSSEHTRWRDIRESFRDLTDDADIINSEIDDCATAQVLLERLMRLRHQTFGDGATPHSNDNVVQQLQRLVRHENRLIKHRDRLLHLLDVDEYLSFDPLSSFKTG